MTKKAEREAARQNAIEKVRAFVKPGDTLYTVLAHVSSSGMMREIKVYAIDNGEPVGLTSYAARILDYKLGKRDGLRVGGCGMDMGFHVVYALASALFPKGHACIGKGCPSNDHSNRETRTEHPDGGYALRQRWM